VRFLANENFPGDAVAALRSAGHDVGWVRIDSPGVSDEAVLDRAMRETRVLLTFDKDFGELAWRAALPASCGIVLLRLTMMPAATAGETIAALIAARDDWAGHFSVIEPGRLRMRPLPGKD
jgi:predicted nuclease of predicted toxin-antitoxin system